MRQIRLVASAFLCLAALVIAPVTASAAEAALVRPSTAELTADGSVSVQIQFQCSGFDETFGAFNVAAILQQSTPTIDGRLPTIIRESSTQVDVFGIECNA